MSSKTKKLKIKSRILGLLSFICTTVPMLVFIGIAVATGSVEERFVICLTGLIAGMFLVINILLKYRIRSTLWVLLLGIYFCLSNITVLLLFLAIGTILDEFCIEPMRLRAKQRYIINKEIDDRE